MIKGLYQTLIIVIDFLFSTVSIKTFFYFYLDFCTFLNDRIHSFPIIHLNFNHILVHKLVFFYTYTVILDETNVTMVTFFVS